LQSSRRAGEVNDRNQAEAWLRERATWQPFASSRRAGEFNDRNQAEAWLREPRNQVAVQPGCSLWV
jgi:hypothetical protein